MSSTERIKANDGKIRNRKIDSSISEVALKYDVSNNIPEAYRFSRMGGWPVTLRASVVRIVFFKLLGTGILAFLMSINALRPEDSLSCAYAAAVNFVACCHYWAIWMIRRQEMPDAYAHFQSKIGGSNQEKDHDDIIIYAQEFTVDAFRYSDWTVTLVLMMLDIHEISKSAGYGPPLFSPELSAFAQTWIILFASIWRFYTNEMRPVMIDGKLEQPPIFVRVIALLSFLISSIIFIFTTMNALWNVPFPPNSMDSGWLYTIILSWIGYPLVAILQRIMIRNVPGNKYDATVSLLKDIAYGSLDVTSKGGLALFVSIRSIRS